MSIFLHALRKIGQISEELIEGETERKQALDLVARKSARQTLAAQRGDLGVESRQSRIGRRERRRVAKFHQRGRALTQKFACCGADASHERTETLREGFRKRDRSRAAEDDEIVT